MSYKNIKNAINWKIFFILLGASLAVSLMALPYALGLIQADLPVGLPVIVLSTFLQALVMFSIAIFTGLYLAKRVGFGLPILEGVLRGEKQDRNFRSILPLSIALGFTATVLIIILSLPFGSLSLDFLRTAMAVPVWKTLLVSFYGGIAEEVLLRLFLMTLFVWITFKVKKNPAGGPTSAGIWLSITLASVIFGLGHLPITSGLTAITAAVVLRAILLNGVAGIIFGWLYWKKGLEAAIVSHFSADIFLHVLTPLVASLFL